MSPMRALVLLALVVGAVFPLSCQVQGNPNPPTLAHTHNQFTFTIAGPYERVFPLFGALEERKWSPGWNPQFAYPDPARDVQGMVFTVEHAGVSAVWTSTAFDEASGHVQYVYVMSAALVTLVDIHVERAGATETKVTVVYERTALKPEANENVNHFARGDAKSGPEWARAINGYLAKAPAK